MTGNPSCNNCGRSAGPVTLPVAIHEMDWWFGETEKLPEGYPEGRAYQWLLCPNCKDELVYQ